MVTVTLVQATANLSRLLAQVIAGEKVMITRHGGPVAHLFAVASPKCPTASRAKFRAGMPKWRKLSAVLLRELRGNLPAGDLAASHWPIVEFSSLLAREIRMGGLSRADARDFDAQFDQNPPDRGALNSARRSPA